MKFHKTKGQSTIEYAVLVMVVLGAFIATSAYVKRGIQGRWRSAVDELGDQYDPRYTNTSINYTTSSVGDTRIQTLNANGGFWTIRTDNANSLETKKGYISIGAY